MNNVNPYESPASFEEVVDPTRHGIWRFRELPPVHQKRAKSGLIAVQFGCIGIAWCLVAMISIELPASFLVTNGFATLIALVLWLTIPGQHHRLALPAMVLLVISMVALFLFAQRANSGFVNGFMKLFGASALAMFLTSKAMVVFMIRSLAVEQNNGLAKTVCELTVIALAVLAAIVSLTSLRVAELALRNQAYWIVMSIALVATVAMTIATHHVMRRLSQSGTDPSTQDATN